MISKTDVGNQAEFSFSLFLVYLVLLVGLLASMIGELFTARYTWGADYSSLLCNLITASLALLYVVARRAHKTRSYQPILSTFFLLSSFVVMMYMV